MSGPARGYVQVRRGLLEHVRRGDITPLGLSAYALMLLGADSRTGIWWGSAKGLAADFGFVERTARDLLESLEAAGHIKRFATPGRHGNYPILLDGYEVRHGVNEDRRLSAKATMDWKNPVYENCEEDVHDNDEDNVEGGASKVVRSDLGKGMGKDESLSAPGIQDASGAKPFNFDDDLRKHPSGPGRTRLLLWYAAGFDADAGFKAYQHVDQFHTVAERIYSGMRSLPNTLETHERFMSQVVNHCSEHGFKAPRGWMRCLNNGRRELDAETLADAERQFKEAAETLQPYLGTDTIELVKSYLADTAGVEDFDSLPAKRRREEVQRLSRFIRSRGAVETARDIKSIQDEAADKLSKSAVAAHTTIGEFKE